MLYVGEKLTQNGVGDVRLVGGNLDEAVLNGQKTALGKLRGRREESKEICTVTERKISKGYAVVQTQSKHCVFVGLFGES